MSKSSARPADYIRPLNMNGLHGRMLRLPPPQGTTQEILFVYGHHSSLERWWGMVQDLNQYGGITMPDLPGFGGMDSFYKLHRKPSIDNLADYLASFVKLRYKRKKLTIVGLSFGFVIATRMLQRYPDLAKKVTLLVSVVGFAHRDDFSFSKPRYWGYRLGASFFSHRLPAFLYTQLALNPLVLRAAYARTHNAKQKFSDADKDEFKRLMDFEIYLWHCNDLRTWMYTTLEFLKLDNCTQQVDLPLWHVSVKADRYFDNRVVEQHLRVIFTKVHPIRSSLTTHAPSVIADIEAAAPFVPKRLRTLLARQK